MDNSTQKYIQKVSACMDKQQQALNNVTSTRNYTTKTTLYACALQYVHHRIIPIDCPCGLL